MFFDYVFLNFQKQASRNFFSTNFPFRFRWHFGRQTQALKKNIFVSFSVHGKSEYVYEMLLFIENPYFFLQSKMCKL